ncbi:MAG TPA: DUF6468 domain-containing protein [Caulobacteraceae bacterium]|jgi:hypothetical protein|nr:DUF6468 domain-containing protein [Caulobacteraceae bacterium]
MSPIAIGLDVLLVGLLLTALFVGLKLNRNLKAMREGQQGFIKAVGELDAAAARAESGLRALRAATEDTHDELLTRIETARGLINRLDAMTDKAARLIETAPTPVASVARPAATPVMPVARPVPPPAALARPASASKPRFTPAAPHPAARELDDDLFEAAPEAPGQRRAAGRS